MPRNYYIFNPGRLSRKQNTLFFKRYKQIPKDQAVADLEDEIGEEPGFTDQDPEIEYVESGERKVIPVEDIEAIYVFGEADFNRKFFNYCSQKQIPVHLFNYFGFYSGTFYPREFLNSGELLVQQVVHQQNHPLRLQLARLFVEGATGNIERTL